MRTGYDFCIPSHFASGWNWAERFLEDYEKLPMDTRKEIGMVFDTKTGKPLSSEACTKLCQLVLSKAVLNWFDLTTSSWRRMAPSLAHYLRMSDTELMALSDWQEKVLNGKVLQVPAMPMHYSSQRYEQSVRTKATLLKL